VTDRVKVCSMWRACSVWRIFVPDGTSVVVPPALWVYVVLTGFELCSLCWTYRVVSTSLPLRTIMFYHYAHGSR
jgi:hypothetical protein